MEAAVCTGCRVGELTSANRSAQNTRIDAVVRKIALLLSYWTLHDLGLSNAEFLGAMNATHNRLYLGASVDRKSLARATGTAAFFNISAEMFEWLASRKDLRFDACFIEGPAGDIELSEEYTARWKSWHTLFANIYGCGPIPYGASSASQSPFCSPGSA
jgi:hypothetical protein